MATTDHTIIHTQTAAIHTKITAKNARQALRDVRLLVHDGRLIAAASLLEKLEAFLEGCDAEALLRVELDERMRRPKLKAELEQLRERAVECREAAEDLSSVRFMFFLGGAARV